MEEIEKLLYQRARDDSTLQTLTGGDAGNRYQIRIGFPADVESFFNSNLGPTTPGAIIIAKIADGPIRVPTQGSGISFPDEVFYFHAYARDFSGASIVNGFKVTLQIADRLKVLFTDWVNNAGTDYASYQSSARLIGVPFEDRLEMYHRITEVVIGEVYSMTA